MAGSWEIPASVAVGILHTEVTTVAWAFGLRNLIIPNGMFLSLVGMPYDHARNTACMRTIESGADYLFFLDSDIIPPRDTILRLMSHKQPIVSGVYCRRSPPHGVPVMLKNGQWVSQLPRTPGLFEVDVVGAGCLLIHRSVLETLQPQRPGKHWFDWRVDMQGIFPPGECLSEDFTFSIHAKRHGFPTLVDPMVRCLHVGFSQVGYQTMEPLNANPVT